jgi:Flp pilus assembly CpaF family ATPase
MSGGGKLSKYSVRGGDVAGRPERFESLNTVRMAGPRWKPIIRLVAHHAEAEIHPSGARGSAELSETGERFEGLLPPIVAAPAFALRKPAVVIFTLEDCRFRADFENFATTCRKNS